MSTTHTSSYSGWVSKIAETADAKRVNVHLHVYKDGEDKGERGAPITCPNGERCREVLMDASAAQGLTVGDFVDANVSLKVTKPTTEDRIRQGRRGGLRSVVDGKV
jgi:hypothetical protein